MISRSHLITPDWPCPEGVLCYVTTRCNGQSQDSFANNNIALHVGDDVQTVRKNRSKLPHADQVRWLNQVHSNKVLDAKNWQPGLEADAIFSSEKNVLCAVMTADCVPILLANSNGQEVAAIHAGWKGLSTHIIKNTVQAMSSEPSSLVAYIGPCISQPCYEVPAPLAEQFAQFNGVFEQHSEEKGTLNLPLIAEHQLFDAGIRSVTQSGVCTYCDVSTFYSHRRATHENCLPTGRFASVIGRV